MATVIKAKQEETSPQRQGCMPNVVSGLARERILEAEQLAWEKANSRLAAAEKGAATTSESAAIKGVT